VTGWLSVAGDWLAVDIMIPVLKFWIPWRLLDAAAGRFRRRTLTREDAR